MKHFILLGVFAVMINVASSQQRAFLPVELKDLAAKTEYVGSNDCNAGMPAIKAPNPYLSLKDGWLDEEDIIGTTWYDLQTNKALQNRIWCYDDGTIGAVWTMGMEATANIELNPANRWPLCV